MTALALPLLAAMSGDVNAQDSIRTAGKLTVGIVARADRTGGGIDPAALENALAKASGLTVSVRFFRSYATLANAQVGGEIDYALHSASSFAAASALCGCIEAVVAPVTSEGAAGIVVDVRSIDGKTETGEAAFGWLSSPYLPQEIAETAWPGMPKSKTRLSGFADLVNAGRADGSLSFAIWFPAAADGERIGDTSDAGWPSGETVWTSGLIPFGPHAVRSDVPEAVRNAMRSLMLDTGIGAVAELDVLNEMGTASFRPVQTTDYAPLIARARAIHVGG